jgi:hypothetical protein
MYFLGVCLWIFSLLRKAFLSKFLAETVRLSVKMARTQGLGTADPPKLPKRIHYA